jgi:hypothetical protein
VTPQPQKAYVPVPDGYTDMPEDEREQAAEQMADGLRRQLGYVDDRGGAG